MTHDKDPKKFYSNGESVVLTHFRNGKFKISLLIGDNNLIIYQVHLYSCSSLSMVFSPFSSQTARFQFF